MPDTLFLSTLTVGKVRIGRGEIWGHFETMPRVGLPNEISDFHGKKPFRPSVVTLSIYPERRRRLEQAWHLLRRRSATNAVQPKR
jgi:hypothetical protein